MTDHRTKQIAPLVRLKPSIRPVHPVRRTPPWSRFFIRLLFWVFLVMMALIIKQPSPSMTIDIKEAGAQGDGLTDDSAVFMRVLHQAAERKGLTRIMIPSGTYRLSVKHPLQLHSNVRLVGRDKPVLKFTVEPPESSGYETMMISGRHVLIDGVIIDGEDRFIRGIGIHPGSANVTITNSVIQNMRQGTDPDSPLYSAVVSGIMIYGDTADIKVTSSLITRIHAMNQQPVARGIMVWNASGASPAKRVMISDNEISYISPREDADGIFFDISSDPAELSDSIIENNRIHHSAKRGIKISAPGVIVRNNHITNPYSGDNRYQTDISEPLPQDMYSAISVYASHVTLIGNIIDGTGSYYAAIEADFDALQHLVIENNKITGGNGVEAQKMTTGIRLGAVRHSRIRDNWIRDVNTGIRAEDTQALKGILSENHVSELAE